MTPCLSIANVKKYSILLRFCRFITGSARIIIHFYAIFSEYYVCFAKREKKAKKQDRITCDPVLEKAIFN